MPLWMIFSDVHLKEWRPFSSILSNGMNSRLMEQVKVLQRVKQIAQQYHISHIFFLGDLVDSLSPTISKIVINTAFYMVQSLAEIANIYLIVGNHDIFGQINTLTPFSSIPRVKIINEVTVIKLDGKTIDLIPCYGKIPQKKSEYCFGHFGIQGATIGNGVIVDEEIEPKMLVGYKLVLAGHFHSRQQVADNAYQVGSVMDINFSSTTEDKGVFLLNPKNDELKFIPILSSKFYTIEINNKKDLEDFIKQYNCQKTNDYFKLRIKTDNITVPELSNNVIVEFDFEPSINEKELIDTHDITNLQPIIKDFIQSSNTALNKDILYKKAIELLEI